MATTRLQLPDFGKDWLHGMEDQYVILSLKHSTPDVTMFWLPNDMGYTDCLVNAGVYSGRRVRGALSYYNDGICTIAIPLTRDALTTLGLYPVVADYDKVRLFLTKRIAETRE